MSGLWSLIIITKHRNPRQETFPGPGRGYTFPHGVWWKGGDVLTWMPLAQGRGYSHPPTTHDIAIGDRIL